MQELAFWKAVIVDESNFLEAIVAVLTENGIRYCAIGGRGVNAYVVSSRYFAFVERAVPASVLGPSLPVSRLEDILQRKIWAAQDLTRRPSKRRKDLLDIERIVDAYPALRDQVPPDVRAQLQLP
jgi:hypothetical protein